MEPTQIWGTLSVRRPELDYPEFGWAELDNEIENMLREQILLSIRNGSRESLAQSLSIWTSCRHDYRYAALKENCRKVIRRATYSFREYEGIKSFDIPEVLKNYLLDYEQELEFFNLNLCPRKLADLLGKHEKKNW